jgi:hypothetical protein
MNRHGVREGEQPMVSTTRLLVRASVALAVLAGATAVGAVPTASAVTSHRPLNDTRPVGSGPVDVDFPIEYFGVVADLASATSHLPDDTGTPFGEARFRVGGSWTAWQRLEQDGAQVPGHFTGALVAVDRADAYQVRGLPAAGRSWRAAAINTTDGPSVVVGQRTGPTTAAARAASGCRSRADWGADESISGWARGDVQAFAPVQVMTVHHTAGSNSPTQDYSATMRAIYSYHVQSNGWSDIGYQYLVDGYGRVYEGRSSGHTSRSCLTDGGDGSDFAHQSGTDQLVTGAHVGSMNSGNLGIALLGCFEATSACAGTTSPTAAAVDGLEGLLASLSTRHRLDPTGTVHYVNPVSGDTRDVRTISAHRDWLATDCPGATLYAQLPAIRSDVGSRLTPSPTVAVITSASCKGATCTFAGTGVGSLRWTFGNGAVASGSPVKVTYTKAATYPVTLSDGQVPPATASRSVTCTVVKRALRCVT